MEQHPAQASVPLDPPTPDVARAYLDEIGTVENRREEHINRRAMGWLDIVGGAVIGGYVTLALSMLRGDVDATFPLLLVALLLWTQLSLGLHERNGAQRRPSALARWGWIALIVMLAGSFAALIVVRFLDSQLPELFFFIPGPLVFVVFLARGIRQLMRARGQAATSSGARRAFSRVESIGTAVIGLVMGAAIAVAAAPNDFVPAVATAILMLGLAVWILSFSMPWGLPSIGAAWRWPQWALMALSAAVLILFVVSPSLLGALSWLVAGGMGVVIAIIFAVMGMRGRKVDISLPGNGAGSA